MATAIAEVLNAWRDAERLLDSLPPIDPDHETVALAVANLRATYRTLAALGEDTAHTIAATVDTVAEARGLLAQIRAKKDRPS